MNLLRVTILASLGPPILFLEGCVGEPACTASGDGALLVPVEIAGQITTVRVEGPADCTVIQSGDCDAGGECLVRLGVQNRVFRVRAQSVGECSVTLSFGNGCADKTAHFMFSGPRDNCCHSACESSAGTQLDRECQ